MTGDEESKNETPAEKLAAPTTTDSLNASKPSPTVCVLPNQAETNSFNTNAINNIQRATSPNTSVRYNTAVSYNQQEWARSPNSSAWVSPAVSRRHSQEGNSHIDFEVASHSDLKCGWHHCKPNKLQRLNSPKWFLFFLVVFSMAQGKLTI